MDVRLLNGGPKVTLIESFVGAVTVILRGPEGKLVREPFETRKKALDWCRSNGYEISVSHLGRPEVNKVP